MTGHRKHGLALFRVFRLAVAARMSRAAPGRPRRGTFVERGAVVRATLCHHQRPTKPGKSWEIQLMTVFWVCSWISWYKLM